MAPPMNYKVSTRRGANMVKANPQRIGEPSNVVGARWATGRNVKYSEGWGVYSVTDVWALKERGADGKVRVVAQHRSREAAEAFVKGGTP